MKPVIDKKLLALVLLSFVARYWEALKTTTFFGDEVVYIPAALHYIKEGRFNYQGVHPPLHHLMTYGGMLLFGDSPVGWRMLNILLGSLSVGVLIAVGKRLFPDKRVAYLAGAFLAVEPMHILLSRTNFIDIGLIFFFLCGVYGTVRYVEDRGRSLLWASVFFGLTMAEKWSFLLSIAAIAAYAMFSRKHDGRANLQERIYVASSFTIVPALVYLLSYVPWFSMGHTLGELCRLQIDMYHQHQASSIRDYLSQFVQFMPSTTPWEWFIKPLIHGIPMVVKGASARYMVFMNDWPIWVLGFPSIAWSLFMIGRSRNNHLRLPLLLFAVSYGQFAVVARPLFLHTAMVVLPFLYLLIAAFVLDMMNRLTTAGTPYRVVMGLVLVWGGYLYPFITGQFVPVELYAPLIQFGKTAMAG